MLLVRVEMIEAGRDCRFCQRWSGGALNQMLCKIDLSLVDRCGVISVGRRQVSAQARRRRLYVTTPNPT